MKVDFFGLFQMFLLVCGGAIAIYHLKDMKDNLSKFLLVICGVVIIMVFVITSIYLKNKI